jgi:hypothetical protein
MKQSLPLAMVAALVTSQAFAAPGSHSARRYSARATAEQNYRHENGVVFVAYRKTRVGQSCSDLTCPHFMVTGIGF